MKSKFLFALLLAFGTVTAQADLFVELPEHEIHAVRTLANLSIGSDLRRHSVRVQNCANDVTHIMLRVQNAPMHVTGAGVVYSDGSSNSYSLSYTFAAGYDSPWMSLDSFRSSGRCVTSVFFTAQSTDPRVRSRVRVLGNMVR